MNADKTNRMIGLIITGYLISAIIVALIVSFNRKLDKLEGRIDFHTNYTSDYCLTKTEFGNQIGSMREDIEKLEKEIENELGKELGQNHSFTQSYGTYYLFNRSLKEKVSRLEQKTDELESRLRYIEYRR